MPTPIAHVLLVLIEQLVRDGGLELVPGATPAALAEEVHRAIQSRSGQFAQFGQTVSAALIASPLVDELYQTDAELAQRLNHLALG